jgi:UDP-N-acetylglucosamine 1-carboxyvinyltransferase
MEQYLIRGGNPLVGEVEIGGAKNSALGILAAAIMCDETVIIRNLPDVNDINVFLNAIKSIGAEVHYPDPRDRHMVAINGKNIRVHEVDNDYIRKIRASYYLIGALLGKYKEAGVALPGGCNIGSRPIDQHQKGFKALGAKVWIDKGMIFAKADELVGRHIYLDVVSVGATINIMLAASQAKGTTIIENPAKEPHVVDVAQFLNQMGADIKGAGTDVIRINGVRRFKAADHEIIPDQIEAGTFMCAAVATRGDVTLKHVIPKHLESISAKLLEMGAEIEELDDAVRVVATKRLTPTSIKTMPYPGFPTDMQSQVAVCLALADGTSLVTEKIFENRFKYTDELTKMGASIKVEGNTAFITGVKQYTGAVVSAPDLRAGAALVIAGLAAEGCTCVEQIQYIQRGYENFEEKIRGLGGVIEKVDVESRIDRDRMMRKMSLAAY